MTVVLRLEGLDVKAGIEDIRTFFQCLRIPDGGVYVVGGSLREAFIAFRTERDGQLAMRQTGMFIKGAPVTLHLSSMEELEHKLESLLKKKRAQPTETPTSLNAQSEGDNTAHFSPCTAWPIVPDIESVPHLSTQNVCPNTTNEQTSNAQSLDSKAAFLLGVCTVLHGLQASHQRDISDALPRVDFLKAVSAAVATDEVKTPEQTLNTRPGYVRLFGLPATTTKDEICHFFNGLTVQEVIVSVKLGVERGCLVKFANMHDAHDALAFNQQSLGMNIVDVRGANEKLWNSALQECENDFDVTEREKPQQSPLKESANKQKSYPALQIKKRSINHLPSKPPKKPKLDTDSTLISPAMERVVMVRNLPKTMTKTEIKELFGCPNLPHKKVLHLLDKEGNRTDTAFLMVRRTEDYDYAMNLTGCHVGSAAIEVSSITKEMMWETIGKTRPRALGHFVKTHTTKNMQGEKNLGPSETLKVPQSMKVDPAVQTCLFIRNMPADVKKNQILSLFYKYKVRMDNITLLHDSDGNGIGEAVVQFKSANLAKLAHSIHSKDFLGTKLLLTLINVEQMQDILAKYI